MKTMKAAVLAFAMCASGCVATVQPATVTFEPDVVVGAYPIGFYDPAFGYWTGYGWDFDFYLVGHPGYGHCYRGCPGWARDNWHHGPRGWHGEPRSHR